MNTQTQYDELKKAYVAVFEECRQIEERVLRQNPEVLLARAKRAAIQADFSDIGDKLNGFAISPESVSARDAVRAKYAALLTGY